MIRLTDVSRHFRRGPDVVKALDRVTLPIPDGRFVALMGPSGSGKSTLLNLLSGIDRADEGDVEVAGQRLNGLSEDELAAWRSRHVGLIFQFYNRLPVLNALENVELPLLLADLPAEERRRRAETALTVVGLQRPLRSPAQEPSSALFSRSFLSARVCDSSNSSLKRSSSTSFCSAPTASATSRRR
jgi:putative ABC transport system ATP-binding protein